MPRQRRGAPRRWARRWCAASPLASFLVAVGTLTSLLLPWGIEGAGTGAVPLQFPPDPSPPPSRPILLLELFPEPLPREEELLSFLPTDPALLGRVQVLTWPGGEAQARRLLGLLERSPLLPGLPSDLPSRALFILAPDQELWDAATGGGVPEWGAGVAYPERALVVIPLFTSLAGGLRERDRTLLHEWAHLGLQEALPGLRIPRWFDEGYAQWASGRWSWEEGWRLRILLSRPGAPGLGALDLDWPRAETDAELAYLLSASAIEFLTTPGGERAIEVLVENWRAEGDFEAAFRRTFGSTVASFEARWVEHVRSRYGWVLVLQQLAIVWTLATLLLLLLVRSRVQRNRERMARLRALEESWTGSWWEGPEVDPDQAQG